MGVVSVDCFNNWHTSSLWHYIITIILMCLGFVFFIERDSVYIFVLLCWYFNILEKVRRANMTDMIWVIAMWFIGSINILIMCLSHGRIFWTVLEYASLMMIWDPIEEMGRAWEYYILICFLLFYWTKTNCLKRIQFYLRVKDAVKKTKKYQGNEMHVKSTGDWGVWENWCFNDGVWYWCYLYIK